MKVKEMMNKAVAIEHNITLKEAAKIMSSRNIGCLVIIRNGKVVGIVTERDIMRNISNLNEKISSIMARKVITISPDDDIDDAALLMTKHKIRRLPVVDSESGELVGIITSTDLIAHSEDISEEFFFD